MSDQSQDRFVRRRLFLMNNLSKQLSEGHGRLEDCHYEKISIQIPLRLRLKFLSPTCKYWRLSRQLKTELYCQLSQLDRDESDRRRKEQLRTLCYPLSLTFVATGFLTVYVELLMQDPPISIESSVYMLGLICCLSVFGFAYPKLAIWNRHERFYRSIESSIKSMNHRLDERDWSSRL